MHGRVAALVLGCLVGCGDPDVAPSLAEDVADEVLADDVAEQPDVLPEPPPQRTCDPLQGECLMPWPSSYFLVADESRQSGYQLTFGPESLPQNSKGKHIDPAPYDRLDGFSPATPIMVHFQGGVRIDDLPSEWHTDASLADDASMVVFEDAAGELTRVPYWVELDSRAPSPEESTLIVRPAVLLKEGTRYIVAMRGLTNRVFQPIEPSDAFVAFRDETARERADLSWRIPAMESVFEALEGQGVERAPLQLAWDFRTATRDGLHARMLFMRDDALKREPDGAALTVEEVVEFAPEDNPFVAYELRGTFAAPHYLEDVKVDEGITAYQFALDPETRLPSHTGVREERFWIRVPRTVEDGTPHGLVLYGHGQNGSGTQVRGGFNDEIAHREKLIFVACDMLGMSEGDVPAIIRMLLELSNFPWLADRIHQGVLNHVMLARAMKARLKTQPELVERGIVVDPTQLYYSGISQGGIYGATILAVSPDITRAHLGVPGNNYPMLIQRSQNFQPFLIALDATYPGATRQLLAASVVQLLWDGADPATYLRHISADPFPNTPPGAALFAPAKGDPQVAVVTNEIAARSNIGIPLMANYDHQRTPEGIEQAGYPRTGSGVVLYDYGNPWPKESSNAPPSQDLPDPHGQPKRARHHQDQMVHFFRTGEIIDVCKSDGCHPD